MRHPTRPTLSQLSPQPAARHDATPLETLHGIRVWLDAMIDCWEIVESEYDPGSEVAITERIRSSLCASHIWAAIGTGHPELRMRFARGLDLCVKRGVLPGQWGGEAESPEV